LPAVMLFTICPSGLFMKKPSVPNLCCLRCLK
jgi:hypothetical protein